MSETSINLLRKYIIENQKIHQKGDQLIFGKDKFHLNEETQWCPNDKSYTIGDLWCFIDSKKKEEKSIKYLTKVKRLKLRMISKDDQKEILDYFFGRIDSSEAI